MDIVVTPVPICAMPPDPEMMPLMAMELELSNASVALSAIL